MRGWTDLSKDTKQKIIKKLDFMSRWSMRSTCRLNREIVDSTPLYIPRVRFSMKNENALIVIYTGIDKFLRMEMIRDGNGTKMYRMENTHNRKEGSCKYLPVINPFPLAFKMIIDLFIQKSVLLGAFELEVGTHEKRSQQRNLASMIRALDSKKIPTKKIVTNSKIAADIDVFIQKNLCDLDILEEAENNELRPGWQLKPRQTMDDTNFPDPKLPDEESVIIDFPTRTRITTPYVESEICMDWLGLVTRDRMQQKAVRSTGFATVRYAEKDDMDMFDIALEEEKLNDHVQMKRQVTSGYVIRWNKSKCGVWAHLMNMENEHKFLDFFKKETCGLRWLCEDCTDPFDYWYYQNIPKRAYLEPEWTSIYYFPDEESKDYELIIKMYQEMKNNYAKIDKKKKVIKGIKSWGFKKQNSKKPIKPSEMVLFHPKDYENKFIYERAGRYFHFSIDLDTLKLKTSGWYTKDEFNEKMKKIISLRESNVIKRPMDDFNVENGDVVIPIEEVSEESDDKNDKDDSSGIISRMIATVSNWWPFSCNEPTPQKIHVMSMEEFAIRMHMREPIQDGKPTKVVFVENRMVVQYEKCERMKKEDMISCVETFWKEFRDGNKDMSMNSCGQWDYYN